MVSERYGSSKVICRKYILLIESSIFLKIMGTIPNKMRHVKKTKKKGRDMRLASFKQMTQQESGKAGGRIVRARASVRP